jgi:hypothetical protein
MPVAQDPTATTLDDRVNDTADKSIQTMRFADAISKSSDSHTVSEQEISIFASLSDARMQ